MIIVYLGDMGICMVGMQVMQRFALKFLVQVVSLALPTLCSLNTQTNLFFFYCMTSSQLIKILQSDWSVAM